MIPAVAGYSSSPFSAERSEPMTLLGSLFMRLTSARMTVNPLFSYSVVGLRHFLAGVDDHYFFHGCIDETSKVRLVNDFQIYNDFITAGEEDNLLGELNPYMKRMRYEFDHWDNAIQGYKETERLNWSKVNAETLKKIHEFAFPEWCHKIEHVHVLDLSEDGYIKPHIDSVKFCGDLIVGLSLLSDSVMRLVGENMVVDALLRRRSLYVMKGSVRYNFTHEILSNDTSLFRDQRIKKSRRISVICRSAPVNTV